MWYPSYHTHENTLCQLKKRAQMTIVYTGCHQLFPGQDLHRNANHWFGKLTQRALCSNTFQESQMHSSVGGLNVASPGLLSPDQAPLHMSLCPVHLILVAPTALAPCRLELKASFLPCRAVPWQKELWSSCQKQWAGSQRHLASSVGRAHDSISRL